MIYLYSYAGLGNRIRSIISGLGLANDLNQKLTIFWKKDEALNCSFFELFERNPAFEVKRFNWVSKLLELGKTDRKIKRGLSKIIYWFLKVDFFMFDDDFKKYVWNNHDYIFHISTLPKRRRNIYISTCNEFYPGNNFLKLLRPNQELQQLISGITSGFSNNIIGVHIRRTDHPKSIEESPLINFVLAMEKEMASDPSVTFYLATDDPLVESDLLKRFPPIFFIRKKVHSRNDCRGIKDAMLDLYCLAKTKKIYGSFESSFSEIAARIGNIPLVIVRKDE